MVAWCAVLLFQPGSTRLSWWRRYAAAMTGNNTQPIGHWVKKPCYTET
jgi:hypothetical protein